MWMMVVGKLEGRVGWWVCRWRTLPGPPRSGRGPSERADGLRETHAPDPKRGERKGYEENPEECGLTDRESGVSRRAERSTVSNPVNDDC